MEIAAGVHSILIPAAAISAFQPPNVYLVLGERSALIDAGHDQEPGLGIRLAYVKEAAPAGLDFIVVSHAHRDHIGGAARLKQATGARLAFHREDAVQAKDRFGLEADLVLEDGQVLDLGSRCLEVVHTPGHTPGHICLYLVAEAMMFTGDQVVGMGTTAIEPPQGDMAAYVQSLHRLLSYELRLICPAHGPLLRQPRRKLEELIQQRLDRERQVLDCLRWGPAGPRELVAEIYPELKGYMVEVAERHMLAHLLKLENEGKVVQEAGSWHIITG